MQKHPALTLGRLKQVHRHLLADRIVGEKHPLQIEFLAHPCKDEQEARAHKGWQKVEPGFSYGPAYQVFWFRLTGNIPKEWAGKEVALNAEIGGERTLWKNNVPQQGIDGPHAYLRLVDQAEGGESLDFVIQAYTMNPSVRVHGYPPPMVEKTDTIKAAEVVTIDGARRDLMFDFQFGISLIESLAETDPNRAHLLAAFNKACEGLDPETHEGFSRSRKIIRNALGSFSLDHKHTIFALGHAHLDTAWLWPLDITHLKMAHTTANQLTLMERYPEYIFVHSQASQYEWLEQEYPELLKRVKDAAKKGQWEPVGSMWVEADCNLTGSESLVRQFLYGRRYFRKHFGTPTDDMWLPDVFGYSAALPQILNQFGIQYFLTQKISWNQVNKFPHNTFWWQGIDGSKIWTHFPPADTYIGDCTPKQIRASVDQHKDHARSDQSLYLFGWGDGGGGPTEEHIEMLRRARACSILPHIEKKRKAVDFFAEAKSKSQDLMTWVGELYLEMHRGTYTSQAANKKFNRQCEFLLRDAEWLCAFRQDLTQSYPAEQLERLWKLVLLNQFHDIIPGSSVREVYDDSDRDYALVVEESTALIEQSLRDFGEKMETSDMQRPVAMFTNAELTTQASTPWTEKEVPSSLQVGDVRYPVQEIHAFGERHLIFETPEESLGTVVVGDFNDKAPTISTRLKVRERKLENELWCVRLDSNGNLTSVTALGDRETEFIEPGKLANLFQIHDDRPNFWGAWDIDPFAFETAENLTKAESVEIVESGPVRVAIEVVRKYRQSTIRQRISLGPTPGIRFDTEVDWHEDHKLLKVAFPLNIHSARASYEIQFGHVERPTHANTSWDMARFEVPAQKWADLSQSDMGAALINDCKYGYDCAGNVLRLSLLRSPKAPDPMCDMGLHRFSYVLLPHFDTLCYSDVIAAGYAFNSPLRLARLSPSTGENGVLPKFVDTDSRNLIVESVKKAEDSNRLIVRLYEAHNTRGKAFVNFIRSARSAWKCNLEEVPLEPLETHEGAVVVPYRPFEIITLAIEF